MTVGNESTHWEVYPISQEALRADGSHETQKALTIKVLKALINDFQEGRVQSMVITALGKSNQPGKVTQFQWILVEPSRVEEMISRIDHAKDALTECLFEEMFNRFHKGE